MADIIIEAKDIPLDLAQFFEPITDGMANVWTLGPEPFPNAHFAVFPSEIPRRAILAGTSERGCCAACGAPWIRTVEKSGGTTGQSWHNHENDLGRGHRGGDNGNIAAKGWETYRVETTGWEPQCHCDAGIVPCTILDPFAGAGTALLVADRLGRDAIGIELSPAYAAMAEKRVRGDAPLFAEVELT